MTEEQLHEYTKIDPWFLAQLAQLHQTEAWLRTQSLDRLAAADLLQVKRRGFSDPQIAKAVGAGPGRLKLSCPTLLHVPRALFDLTVPARGKLIHSHILR